MTRLAPKTRIRTDTGRKQAILSAWTDRARRLSKSHADWSLTQLAAAARTELTAALRINCSRRVNMPWREESETTTGDITSLVEIPTRDVPDFLAEVHQWLLGYELLQEAAGRLTARRCPRGRRRDGVYFTPPAVADYITRRTLGPMLDETTLPRQQHEPLTILDPACGAGSFLLAALEQLLQWYRRDGSTISAAEIAARHLYGVDIDKSAIQLAEFNLAWTCHHEDSPASIGGQASFNLVCGDALAGSDFLASSDGRRSFPVGAVDWKSSFSAIDARGGFACIVANPPYRRELAHGDLLEALANSPLGQYRTARMDLWYYFAHRAIHLLGPRGRMGFITNSYWLQAAGAHKLREALRSEVHLEELFLLDDAPIFSGISGKHAIFVAGREVVDSVCVKRAVRGEQANAEFGMRNADCDADSFLPENWRVVEAACSIDDVLRDDTARGPRVLARDGCELTANVVPLGSLGLVRQGIAENPGTINARTNTRFGNRWQVGEGVFSLSTEEVDRLKLSVEERRLLRPYSQLAELGRYHFVPPERWLVYATPQTWPELAQCPRLAKYLERFRPVMEARRETRQGKLNWWQLHWPRDERLWHAGKLLCLQFATRPSCVPVEQPAYVPFSVNVFVPGAATREHLYYFAAVINSEMLRPWLAARAKRRGIGLEINGHLLREAPIRRINFSDPAEIALHDQIAQLVGERLQPGRNEHEDQIEAALRQLYGDVELHRW